MIRKVKWQAVDGFEGLYEVSNLGEVRSLDRIEVVQTKNKQPYNRVRKGRMLKQYVDRYG